MTRQGMREFAASQVTWYENQNKWLMDRIERINNRLKQTRKEDKEQQEFARTYKSGKYAHLYEGNYQGDETRKLINERRRHQRELKKNAVRIEHYKREVEKYTDAPQEAPAAEAEHQPTETENAPQAATQAAELDTLKALRDDITTDPNPDTIRAALDAIRQQDPETELTEQDSPRAIRAELTEIINTLYWDNEEEHTMSNPITAAIIDSMNAPAPAQSITATIIGPDGTPYRAQYSAHMLDSLRTESRVLDIQDDTTGELVYIKPDDAPAAQAEADPTETTEQTTTNEQKEEDHTMSTTANELQKYVDGIAADLRRLYEADPTDEEREAAEENGDACDLYSYFEDVLDVEYTISSRGDYLGARIAVALGGPNIYIDTREGEVKGYWGTDRAERWIPSEICEEIDSIMEEYYSIVRGA